MVYLLILCVFLSGCGGFEHRKRIDGKMTLVESFKTWGTHHTITDGERVDTDSKVEPFKDAMRLGVLNG